MTLALLGSAISDALLIFKNLANATHGCCERHQTTFSDALHQEIQNKFEISGPCVAEVSLDVLITSK